jgi:plasmid stabilization system protein ParE
VRVHLRRAAAADLDEAFIWYETQQEGLGDDFLTRVTQLLDILKDSPNLYPVVHRDARRALVKRFPYGIFYRVIGENVVIVACFHGSRDPRVWRERS